jgi:hypothetical protein
MNANLEILHQLKLIWDELIDNCLRVKGKMKGLTMPDKKEANGISLSGTNVRTQINYLYTDNAGSQSPQEKPDWKADPLNERVSGRGTL